MQLLDKIKNAIYYNVSEPYPGRRLQHIVSVPYRGERLICFHQYEQTCAHEEILDKTAIRVSIRHYTCWRCGRVVHVYGPGDDQNIEHRLAKSKGEKNNHA